MFDNLSRNADIITLRQDIEIIDRGVALLDRKDYIQKCVSILNTSETLTVTKYLERKVQRTVQKIKKTLLKNFVQKLYKQVWFLAHQKYINYNSSNKKKDRKNLQ